MTPDTVRVSLPRNDWGQIVDGLTVMIEQWNATACYLNTGKVDDDILIREATNAHEATAIASFYERIRDEIARQLAE